MSWLKRLFCGDPLKPITFRSPGHAEKWMKKHPGRVVAVDGHLKAIRWNRGEQHFEYWSGTRMGWRYLSAVDLSSYSLGVISTDLTRLSNLVVVKHKVSSLFTSVPPRYVDEFIDTMDARYGC